MQTGALARNLSLSDSQASSLEIGGGFSLRFVKRGQGDPLVLLHTIRTQLEYFERLVPLLEGKYTVYLVDLPGHGGSTIAPVDHTEPMFREAIKKFINKLDLRGVVLVGESIGGTLALTVSTEIPDRISRVVALNPYDYGEAFGGGIRRSQAGWMIGLFAIFGRYTIETQFILSQVFAGGIRGPAKFPPELVRQLLAVGKRPGYRAAEYSLFKNWRTWLDARGRYSLVKVPVTLAYSEYDWSFREERERNKQDIPNVRTLTVAHAGHFASLERPQHIAEVIRDHLA